MKTLIRISLLIVLLAYSITASLAQVVVGYGRFFLPQYLVRLLRQSRYLLCVLLLVAFTGNVNAQTLTLTGTLTSSDITCASLVGYTTLEIGNGTIIPTTTLTINTIKDLTSCANPSNLVIKNHAVLRVDASSAIVLKSGSSIYFETGGSISFDVPCPAFADIYIGSILVANCKGKGGGNPKPLMSFDELVSFGGTGYAASNSPICQGSQIQLFSSPPNDGYSYFYSWTGPPGSGFISSDRNPIIDNATLVMSGWYYVTMTSSGYTLTVGVNVTVNTTPAVPTGTVAQPFCSGTSPTVANLTATGTTIQWYAASSGGTALATSTALVNNTHYFATQTIMGCESTSRFDVTVIVNTIPAAPTGTAVQSFCSGISPRVANLAATGTAIQWYDASSGGTALATSTSLVNNTHYYASQTIGGCESTSRLDVTVTVNIAPNISVQPTSQTVCKGSSVTFNVTASGIPSLNYQWRKGMDDIHGAVSDSYTIPSVTATDDGWYNVKVSNGCLPDTISKNFDLVVNSINAGIIDKGSLNKGPDCAPLNPNLALSTVSATGPSTATISYQWEQSKDGGDNWLPASGSSTNNNLTFNPDPMNVTTSLRRVATSTLNGISCSANSNVLTYIVYPLPNVFSILPGGPIPDVCVNSQITVTNATPGGVWSTSDEALATVSGGIVMGIGAGTVSISYTVTDGNGCSKSANRTVHIIALPVIAFGTSVFIGGTITLSPTIGGTWISSDVSKATVTNAGIVTGVAVGSATFTFKDTATGCNSTTSAVAVIALPCNISPNTAVSTGSSAIYSAPADMDSYDWLVTGNGSITAGGTSTDQTVTVLAGNNCNSYSVNLKITKNGASSTCSQNISVTDNQAPSFTLPSFATTGLATGYCPADIYEAKYNEDQSDPVWDLTYHRPDYFLFGVGVGFNMLTLLNLADNCALPANPISWTIDMGNNGSIEYSGTGQLSAYGTAIQFPIGDNLITYTVTDAAGNTSVPQSVDLVVIPRPIMTKIP